MNKFNHQFPSNFAAACKIKFVARCHGIALLAAVAFTPAAHADLINFDIAACHGPGGVCGVSDGTVINTMYAGVTFSNPLGGDVYARDGSGFAPSSPNVVSIFASGVPAYDAFSGAVDATFSTPQSVVSIDARPVGPIEFLGSLLNRPFLEAYSGSTFLGRILYSGPLPTGCCAEVGPAETLTLTFDNITRVRFSSQQSQSSTHTYGLFDNLSYATTTVPVPGAAWLFGSGLLGLVGIAKRKERSMTMY